MLSNFDNYEFRASSVWNLFLEPKTKAAKEAGEFSEGCKTFLHSIFLKEKYGFEKQSQPNKYFEKGLQCETKAISLVNEVLFPDTFLVKNTERKSNGFVTGECDNCEVPNTVFDTKCCWDLETFHFAEPIFQYEIQLNCYGLLYGCDRMLLCYCLLNTPKELAPYDIWYDYENTIPATERLKFFEVQKIPNFETILQEKVIKAREYLNKLTLQNYSKQ